MKYFLDTEFIEGFRKPWFGKRRHFIDLISIGIVDENRREFYAISKEFDLNYAWKDEWIRKNVLLPIHSELTRKAWKDAYLWPDEFDSFTKRSMKNLLSLYGKSNKEIADAIRVFVYSPAIAEGDGLSGADNDIEWWLKNNTIDFYAYYADYDWVLFCSLFGRMIDLPKGFPMYCIDLKQILDSKSLTKEWKQMYCPDPIGEHNALIDAKWNLKLYNVQSYY